MSKKEIAFIYKNKCHPVTQAFANRIDATPHKITGPINAITTALKIPEYNYYFIESVMSMITPITKRLLKKKCIIIYRGNDELFANTPAYLGSKNPIKRAILKYLIKNMDAISVESEKQISEVQQHTNVPIAVAESFVATKETLEKIKPKPNTNNFLFIGAYRPPYDHKNIKQLIAVFNKLEKFQLTIIGKNTKALQKEAKSNIEIHDFVDNLTKYWENTTFYIHLPKYEAGPITLLEAMLAGRIPITNKYAGHSSYVKEQDKRLIITSNNTKEIADQIRKITQISPKERKAVSENFKKSGVSHFSKGEMCEKFRQTWKSLVEQSKKIKR
jgi:glycosyltransferase involved in cell wall biosynthesis